MAQFTGHRPRRLFARETLRSLLLVAGLFAMHGLGAHGTAREHGSGPLHGGLAISSSDMPMQALPDPRRATPATHGLRIAHRPAQPQPSGSLAGACVAVIGMLLFVGQRLRLKRPVLRSIIGVLATDHRHPGSRSHRLRDPPHLLMLSVIRC